MREQDSGAWLGSAAEPAYHGSTQSTDTDPDPEPPVQDSSRRLRLQELPNELLDHVIDFLETQCPSEVNWHQTPDPSLRQSSCHDFKHLSLTSHQFRASISPRLFTNIRADVSDLTLLLPFLTTNSLTRHITSAAIHIPPSWPSDEQHFVILPHITSPFAFTTIAFTSVPPTWWSTLLSTLPALSSLTILAPPRHLGALFGHDVPVADSWLFNMPYHALRLQRPAPPVLPSPPTGTATGTATKPAPHLPWPHLSLHESSFLKAYSQYEYFLRVPPSLLSPPPPKPYLFGHIRALTYVAIFPFYNHVDVLLASLASLPLLTSLTTRLAPHPESRIVEDEMEEAKGHIDVNDAWMEFETSYVLLGETVGRGRLEGLREYVCLDVEVEGVRVGLEEGLRGRLGEEWVYGGEGTGRWWRGVEDGEGDGEGEGGGREERG